MPRRGRLCYNALRCKLSNEARPLSQSIANSGNAHATAPRIDPNRLAWGVLLLAFAIFCVIFVFVIVGVDFFLFQSTVPMTVTLNVGRGSVAIGDLGSDDLVGRNGASLTKGMVISTDPQSQGTIRFKDDADHLVASITLQRSASLTLLEAAKPRFEWSRTEDEITLDNVVGKVDIDIPVPANKRIRISAQTPGHAIVNFEGSGSYSIEAASEQLRVFNRNGSANIIAPDLQAGRDIPVDGAGIVNYADNSVELHPGYVDLLADTKFEMARGGDVVAAAEKVWVCGNDPGDNPTGLQDLAMIDGVQALRFVRDGGATTHGRTSCVQSFGQNGINVSSDSYNYLGLRATFYIDYQSLAACGTDGSECPLMLRMDYIDADGKAQKWFHGFYAREEDNYPLRCATCPQDHDRINEKAWYTYESPNFLTFFKPEAGNIGGNDLTPRTIVALWFYASGHQYDVWVSEMALVAAQVESETAPPEG